MMEASPHFGSLLCVSEGLPVQNHIEDRWSLLVLFSL